MDRLFAPGCALLLYKPDLAARLHRTLERRLGPLPLWRRCCRHDPRFERATEVINVCPGCDKRFRRDYPGASTVSVWELLARMEDLPLPDYHGSAMAIIDACPTRARSDLHAAIRSLLRRMNVTLREPRAARGGSACCGDTFWGALPTEAVKAQMRRRAAQLPEREVVVYCVSCSKAMFNGGRSPRYLVDLLFGEPTTPGTVELDAWHAELEAFAAATLA